MAFSRMGKGRQTRDVTWNCHTKHYEMVEQEQHDVAVVENVPEYTEAHAMSCLNPDEWHSESAVIDPRCFGQGTARARRYILLHRKSTMKTVEGITMTDVLDCLKARPCLTASDYFWKEDCKQEPLSQSQETRVLSVKFETRYAF